jgi:nicotinamide mononucleotide transporter
MVEALFSQYAGYPTHEIVLEITAVVFGLLSVLFAKKNNILVFPTGLVSTLIFVYLLWRWSLLGDMIINVYYVVMSIYGWYHWSRKKDKVDEFPIAKATNKELRLSGVILISSMLFVVLIYVYFEKFTNIAAYVDTITTGIFFAAMWLMARRKLENWLLWIIGDIISIPLYLYKGYTFTSIQYIIFTIIAFYGYIEWKKETQQRST